MIVMLGADGVLFVDFCCPFWFLWRAMAMGCLVVNASGVLPGVATGIQGVACTRWRLRQQDSAEGALGDLPDLLVVGQGRRGYTWRCATEMWMRLGNWVWGRGEWLNA